MNAVRARVVVPMPLALEESKWQVTLPTLDNCIATNFRITGSNDERVKDIKDAAGCKAKCAGRADCNHFSYDSGRKVCTLIKQVESGQLHVAGFFSGPKTCESAFVITEN